MIEVSSSTRFIEGDRSVSQRHRRDYSARVLQRIVDSGWVPEPMLHAGIRAVCALRLRQEQRRASGYRAGREWLVAHYLLRAAR